MKRILVTITVLALALAVQIRHQESAVIKCLKDLETGHYNCNKSLGYYVRGNGYLTLYNTEGIEVESCKQEGLTSIKCYQGRGEYFTGVTMIGSLNDDREMWMFYKGEVFGEISLSEDRITIVPI